MPHILRRLFLSLALPFFLIFAGGAGAATPVQQHNSNALWFENWIGLSNAMLVVRAPDGQITKIHTASGTPVFQLSGVEILDGVYRYELSAATDKKVKSKSTETHGRGAAHSDMVSEPYHLHGTFSVSRGVIITPEDIEEGSTD